jgi:predicted ATPase
LPLIVQGCVMPPGGTLIAQQPEIHLNPAQQDIMTDFLIEVCRSGRRVIIETHSEHILGRLRRRIAEGETVSSDQIAIYYSDSDGSRSNIRRIEVGGLGQIDVNDWPSGFFNEQLTNSMEMVRAQSRRRRVGD